MEKFNNIWKNPNNQNIHYTKNKLPYEHNQFRPKKIKRNQLVAIFSSIWNGKDKVKRKTIISDYKSGGQKMIHLESYIEAQRIMCLKKYNENYSSTWKYILDFYLKKVGGKYLLQCNYEISKLPIEVPLFL